MDSKDDLLELIENIPFDSRTICKCILFLSEVIEKESAMPRESIWRDRKMAEHQKDRQEELALQKRKVCEQIDLFVDALQEFKKIMV